MEAPLNNFDFNDLNADAQRIANDGQKDFYKLKRQWSWMIFGFVGVTLLFEIFLLIAIGFKIMDFTGYTNFLYSMSGELFLQMVGMGYIVANHLFPSKNDKKNRI